MAYFGRGYRTNQPGYVEKREIEAKRIRMEELEDLCVVGYACKLFRDNDTALQIHRGEFLVPWMGDTELMMDRYDGRGHLSNLSDYENTPNWNQIHQLSEEEARIEALCDEERYLALTTDLLQDEELREEEQKRIAESYGVISGTYPFGAVGFNYGGQGGVSEEYDPTMPTEDEAEKADRLRRERSPTPELEEPFIAPKSFHLPPGIETPATKKLHAIIEKTALFVSSQNPQMEIVIKARQAKNPQFDFLNYDHYLNPYYRHVSKSIKAGTYVPIINSEEGDANTSQDNPEYSDEDDHYLNPLLLGGFSHIQKPTQHSKTPAGFSSSSSASSYHSAPSSHEYNHPETSNSQDYEALTSNAYYQTPSQASSSFPSSSSARELALPVVEPAPPVPEPAPDYAPDIPGVPSTIDTPEVNEAAPAEGSTTETDLLANYYASAASELVNAYLLSALTTSAPPPPPDGEEPSTSDAVDASYAVSNSIVDPSYSDAYAQDYQSVNPELQDGGAQIEPTAPVIPPPPDVQPIIDKLAQYVAKNGDEFEASIRAKGDPRFEFLEPSHCFHGYYQRKRFLIRQEMEAEALAKQEQLKVPVSFSIKNKEYYEQKSRVGKSALPIEDSEDEDDTLMQMSTFKPPDVEPEDNNEVNELKKQIALALLASVGEATSSEPAKDEIEIPTVSTEFSPLDPLNRPMMPELYQSTQDTLRDRPYWNELGRIDYNHALSQRESLMRERDLRDNFRRNELARLSYRDEILDSRLMRPLPRPPSRPPPPRQPEFISREELAKKQAEKLRLENRLAQAARQKMAGISKERQLQLERKKKAAMFLNKIKADADEDNDKRSRSSSRDRSLSRDRSSSPAERRKEKAAPKAYQTSFESSSRLAPRSPVRRTKRSRSPSPPKPSKLKEPPSVKSTTLGAAIAALRKKSGKKAVQPSNGVQPPPATRTNVPAGFDLDPSAIRKAADIVASTEAKKNIAEIHEVLDIS